MGKGPSIRTQSQTGCRGIQTAKQIIEELKAKELYCLIADGTGFGYAQTYNLPLKDMLAKLDIKAKYFLGDAYYGKSAEMLKLVKEKGMSAIAPVRDTIHMKVRNSYRLWDRENYEKKRDIYKRNRYRVEQVIGIGKNKFGDRDMTKDFHVASLYVLGRFVLYNLMLLLGVLLLFFLCLEVGAVFEKLVGQAFTIFKQAQYTLTK